MDRATALAIAQSKSVGLAVILTMLFGGLGLFYATIPGALVISFFELIAWVVTVFTFGFGAVFVIPVHIIAIIWAILAVQSHNKRLLSR